MTYNELTRRFPKASHAFYKANCSVAPELPDAKPEQASGSEPIQGDEVKEGSKASTQDRIRVRITRFGSKLLDPDNLGGAKLLIDELRYAKLIADDCPASIELELVQVKTPKTCDRGTLIEIYPI